METRTELSEYKGHTLLSLIETDSDRFPTKFSFGKKKAQMIMANIETIRAFATEGNTESVAPRVPSVVPGVPLPPGGV